MFTEEELDLLESAVERYASLVAETSVEDRQCSSILEKLEEMRQ